MRVGNRDWVRLQYLHWRCLNKILGEVPSVPLCQRVNGVCGERFFCILIFFRSVAGGVLHRTIAHTSCPHRQGPRCVSPPPLRRSLAAPACGACFCGARGGLVRWFLRCCQGQVVTRHAPSAPPPSSLLPRSNRQGASARGDFRACSRLLRVGRSCGASGAVRGVVFARGGG